MGGTGTGKSSVGLIVMPQKLAEPEITLCSSSSSSQAKQMLRLVILLILRLAESKSFAFLIASVGAESPSSIRPASMIRVKTSLIRIP
jgi:hypothetical protein